ncbi:hypothetical protein CRM22_002239 [Opisthorchis felineus]|uniref:CSD domain-containing protein n=1 Tax=Opisthorchis felineus TaxID=147828 RepID=A0A4S2M7E8_OPIFE|nr:hypothetical protein CRM22_002239 [Opisthorchis felineus]
MFSITLPQHCSGRQLWVSNCMEHTTEFQPGSPCSPLQRRASQKIKRELQRQTTETLRKGIIQKTKNPLMFARYPWPEGQDFDSLRQSSSAPGPSTLVSSESSVSYRGRIKWFSSTRRFGFIIVDPSEEEIFFHQSNIRGILTPELTPNFPVSFMIRLTTKGPEAFNVRPYEEMHTFTYPQLSRTESRPQLAVPSSSMRGPSGVHPRRSVIRPTRRFRCYNCGQYASHKAAFCPMEPMRKCCYRCRSSTHLLADCPLPPASFLQPQRFVSQSIPFTTEAGISSEHRSPVLRKL